MRGNVKPWQYESFGRIFCRSEVVRYPEVAGKSVDVDDTAPQMGYDAPIGPKSSVRIKIRIRKGR